ncbi:cytosine/uracil/thiamine/allantoin permease [Glutamicibacter nicotianae]|nr:cytosine/uracil/thiamine/allantoin permease [Glutamicibacter nicotianae]
MSQKTPEMVPVDAPQENPQAIDRANPFELNASLYNQDLAPTTRKGRTWNSYSIFTLRANDVHSLGNYTFAIGLFALGIGAVLLFVLLNFSGFMGEKTGVPFSVMSRIAFGITGAQVRRCCAGPWPSPGSASRPTSPPRSSRSW